MAFRLLTAGESHGKGLIGTIEGLPAGLKITAEEIHQQLRRRKLGYGRGARQKIEDDAVEIASGVRFGETLGSPISLLIWNKDWTAWKDTMQVEPLATDSRLQTSEGRPGRKVSVPRPGHADWVGGLKYHHSDMRNVLERSSARETTMRVALGSVARKFLEELGITIGSRVTRIGKVQARDPESFSPPGPDASMNWLISLNAQTDASPVRCLDVEAEKAMIHLIDQAKEEGNTLGGVFEVLASNVPVGLGSYSHWDRRIEGKIGQAFLSLNAIKGVEVGLGFEAAGLFGSEVHDSYTASEGKVAYASNHSGGIDGGMTTGQTLIIRAAMKPLSTLMRPLPSVNLETGEVTRAHVERSDVCAVPAAAVIGESLLALVLAEAVLEKFGGDSLSEILPRVRTWREGTEVRSRLGEWFIRS